MAELREARDQDRQHPPIGIGLLVSTVLRASASNNRESDGDHHFDIDPQIRSEDLQSWGACFDATADGPMRLRECRRVARNAPTG